LNQVIRRLQFTNVQAIATDVAQLEQQAPGFDVAVSRAVAAPDLLWGLAQPLLAPQGKLVLQTNVRAIEQPAEHSQAWVDAQVTVEAHTLEVPGLQSLHDVLVLSQRKPT